MKGPLSKRARRYAAEILVYARESHSIRDFLRVMRVRLSQSKVGALVCPRPIEVDVALRSLGDGVRLRSHTSDISVLGEILVSRSYEIVASAAGEPRAIVDLGANIGLTARLLLERFPDARLVSVEPEPGNVAVLRHNLEPYGDRAHVIAAFAGGRERKVAVVSSRGAEFGTTMVDDAEGDLDVVTMPMVLAKLGADRIDLFKCDIEGAEAELFEDSATWISRVGVLAVECHDSFKASDLRQLLGRNGVSYHEIAFDATPQFGCEQIVLRLTPPTPADGQRPQRDRDRPRDSSSK